MSKKVIIIGGGFGGLAAARVLSHTDFEVLLIDKRNHHVFQPLLYQVATSSLSPAEIAYPLRSILKDAKNVRVILGNVIEVNKEAQYVKIRGDSDPYPFDYLIVAAGARHAYFGQDDWIPYAPGLKTIRDALQIREHMLMSFEQAERCHTETERKPYLTFVVVGGGPTGVEMAGAISEIAKQTMIRDFRAFDPRDTQIILVEAGDRILVAYPPELSQNAKDSLEELGVQVKLNCKITHIDGEKVIVDGTETIETRNVIWAAGNMASPLMAKLSSDRTRSGQVKVDPDLTLPGYPMIFCIGDCAAITDATGKQVPGIAPAAVQAGTYAAKIILRDLKEKKRPPFIYTDKGIMATIGKNKAVALLWGIKLNGFIAWVIWGAVHILFLINFKTKLSVILDWIWSFMTGGRSVRLISTYRERDKKITKKPLAPMI